MDRRTNPFHELYVTETISSDEFVNLFSPRLVENALPLFLPGNAVVKGIKGSGKSMLLALLKPDVRIAYRQTETRFPVPLEQQQFIGAGVNLLRSGAADFAQRNFPTQGSEDERDVLPLYFGDFLNYWIAEDLLRSICTLLSSLEGVVASELGIDGARDTLDAFARACGALDCWFGYLRNVSTYCELMSTMRARILEYRAFLNFNTERLPQEIVESKTVIGEPISRLAELLSHTGVMPKSVEIFIRIDQYEEIYNLEGLYRDRGYGALFREMVNKVVGRRDPNVSYRIGTRGYAWADHLRIFGTAGFLEEDRDYKIVDLDEMLRRHENTRGEWMFPYFAEDVFRRRLRFAGFKEPLGSERRGGLVEHVLGTGLRPEDKAIRYTGRDRRRAVQVDDTWPLTWQETLLQLADSNPLNARLAEAWVRQKLGGKEFPERPQQPWPWNRDSSWRKERIEQALLQIAGACAQRPIYCGRREVQELSGANISVFINICQQIWAAWLRTVRKEGNYLTNVPTIDNNTQSVGILEASTRFFRTIPQQLGDSSSRQRFINVLGNKLSRRYYEDRSLSNPGHNGISISTLEFERNERVARLLQNMSDYGELFSILHTSKERDRIPRIKFYLNPILSPFFRLSHKHQKEPVYLHPKDIEEWMAEADGLSRPKSPRAGEGQAELPLFTHS
jgi:hypothetical protein